MDEALVLVFDAGGSYTGEDVVEFQVHGSPAAINAVLAALGEMDGLRPAEAGEFTRRSLETGQLDLAQVEGLADLLDAETEAQRRQAMRVFSGAIGAKAESWRKRLLRAAALLEATIDFADEDVPVDVTPEVMDLIQGVRSELLREANGAKAAERVREGFEVAIVGRPNTGKSTLLNALAGREAAITSEIAGTTRDVIEVRMDIAGLAVTLLDTAGMRESADRIEAMGIERAKKRAADADLCVLLLDEQGMPEDFTPSSRDIVLRAKADYDGEGVSGLTGRGLDVLVQEIGRRLGQQASGAGTMTRERHVVAIQRAAASLENVENQLSMGAVRSELAAEDLRTSIRALDSLVGRIDVESILGEIFSSFCIGK